MEDQRQISVHVAALKHTFAGGITRPIEWRVEQLRALDLLLVERETEFETALFNDLGKSGVEAQITELGYLRSELAHALKKIKGWVKPERVSIPAVAMPARGWIRPEPLGTVLIIAPWNYPLMLALSPLIGAIAAGNTAVVKPSEVAPHTSAAIARWLPEYLDERAVRVIEGGVEETTELLAERFDHIFYTGNGAVGRIIARAAAEHLTPITLELGGKSPLYVDDSVDLKATAKRIAWAKYVNLGQTCVAPDYVLGTAEVLRELEPHLTQAIHDLYGNAAKENPDYGRIISRKQFDRLSGYLGDGRIVTGGAHDADDLFIEPTVLADVSRDASIMQSEIFGPILPLIAVDSIDDAINQVVAGDKPLSAYVFSNRQEVRSRWEQETSSGALTFNAPILHLTVPDLPFGGVGESGMGAYHGKRSFDVFSHQKAVFTKPLVPDTLSATIMPPFTKRKEHLIRNLLEKFR